MKAPKRSRKSEENQTETLENAEELKMINVQNQAIISALEAKIDSLESAVARAPSPSESENEIEKSCQQENFIIIVLMRNNCLQSFFTRILLLLKIKQVTTSSVDLSDTHENIHVELDVQKKMVAELKENLESKAVQISDLTSRLTSNGIKEEKLRAEIENIYEQLQKAEQRETDISSQLASEQNMVKIRTEEIATLKCDLLSKTVSQSSENSSENETIKKKDARISELEKLYESSQDTHSKLISEMTTIEANEQSLHDEISNLQGVVSRLEMQHSVGSKFEEENQRLTQTLLDLESELNRLRKASKSGNPENEENQRKLLLELNEEKQALKLDRDAKTEKLEKATKLYREKLDEVVKLSKELDKSKTENLQNLKTIAASEEKVRKMTGKILETSDSSEETEGSVRYFIQCILRFIISFSKKW